MAKGVHGGRERRCGRTLPLYSACWKHASSSGLLALRINTGGSSFGKLSCRCTCSMPANAAWEKQFSPQTSNCIFASLEEAIWAQTSILLFNGPGKIYGHRLRIDFSRGSKKQFGHRHPIASSQPWEKQFPDPGKTILGTNIRLLLPYTGKTIWSTKASKTCAQDLRLISLTPYPLGHSS